MAMTLSPWPFYDDFQIKSVSRVLSSGKVNSWTGSETLSFQHEFSAHFGCEFSLALANGTLALDAAYRSLSLGPGDELITTPRTFIATASAAVLLGVKPVFADVNPNSGSITANTIEPLITPRTRAISVVHLGGWPADMPAIIELATSYGIHVIEDCAQAHGASINGKSVGTFGDISAWSFCQDKIISTGGEGGMVSTSRADLWDAIWSLKDHGKNFRTVNSPHHYPGFRWLHESFGSNYRLTEMQSAIGRVQLSCLSDWTAKRSRNANYLAEALSHIPCIRVPMPENGIQNAWYKFYAYVIPSALSAGWTRDRIIEEISSLGFPAYSGTCGEIYLEKCFLDAGLAPTNRLPVARQLAQTSLMFLVHPTITSEQLENYARTVVSVLKTASL